MFGLKLIRQSEYERLLQDNSIIQVKDVERTVVLARLETETYLELEKKVGNTLVSNTTSDIEAGFKLGVQHALKLLRDGYVIQRSH